MLNSTTISVACIQLNSGAIRCENLERASSFIERAAEKQCKIVLLPENFSFMGADESEKLSAAEEKNSSSILTYLSNQARNHGIIIIGGTIPLKSDNSKKIRNSCPVFSASGKLIALYDKMHLFDADLDSEKHYESASVEAGKIPETASVNGWKIGLSICYDLRFPELYRHYSSIGCNMLAIPAAFTRPTGKAHWEVLLRARAIENQAYVIAAGQSGVHPGNRKTWGHSMIVDPWGKVLATSNNGEGLITAELSLNKVKQIREALPALKHRRV